MREFLVGREAGNGVANIQLLFANLDCSCGIREVATYF